MGLDTLSLTILAGAFFAWGVWWFLRKNDELPLAIAAFNAVFMNRLVAVTEDMLDWVNFDYGVGFTFYGSYPNIAATYMLLGGVCLVAAYCLRYRAPAAQVDDENFLGEFFRARRPIIVGLFVAFFVVNLAIRLAYARDAEALVEHSYAYLFTLANNAFLILIAALLLFSGRGTWIQKAALFGVLAAVAFYTLSPSLRFSVLGWAVALTIIATRGLRARARLGVLAGLGLVVAIGFSVLGAMRSHDSSAKLGDLVDHGVESLRRGTDVNMIDGFVMLMQVYPDILEYGLGREHLEIVLRPIPRAIWPDKPPGGWQQKLAAETGQPFFGTGISPSLYGSFYGEGGVAGVVILAILYGILFAKYVNWANTHGSSLRWILRGVLIACLFPLMRGGDIPGIAAFIGMSYWPLALFVWQYHRALRRRRFAQFMASRRRADRVPPEVAQARLYRR